MCPIPKTPIPIRRARSAAIPGLFDSIIVMTVWGAVSGADGGAGRGEAGDGVLVCILRPQSGQNMASEEIGFPH
jgi:hypothetical protein